MKTIIGNWKMHMTVREAVALARAVMLSVRGKKTVPGIVICPTFTSLADIKKIIARSRVGLGAQDMFWETEGSFTGEVSWKQLKDVGCTHVILGHSERRKYLEETDEMVNKKLLTAIKNQLIPIVCVGESAKDRNLDRQYKVVRSQVRAALKDVTVSGKQHMFFAYEPVWAIGGKEADTPEDARNMHEVIREVAAESGLKEKYFSVIYGGSIDSKNAYDFLREQQIDGLLIGGASLKPKEFDKIIKSAKEVMEAQN